MEGEHFQYFYGRKQPDSVAICLIIQNALIGHNRKCHIAIFQYIQILYTTPKNRKLNTELSIYCIKIHRHVGIR